jgi:hypothetical protein
MADLLDDTRDHSRGKNFGLASDEEGHRSRQVIRCSLDFCTKVHLNTQLF